MAKQCTRPRTKGANDSAGVAHDRRPQSYGRRVPPLIPRLSPHPVMMQECGVLWSERSVSKTDLNRTRRVPRPSAPLRSCLRRGSWRCFMIGCFMPLAPSGSSPDQKWGLWGPFHLRTFAANNLDADDLSLSLSRPALNFSQYGRRQKLSYAPYKRANVWRLGESQIDAGYCRCRAP